ncbi:MAG: O-methyltransferase [Chitinophagales bacterium]
MLADIRLEAYLEKYSSAEDQVLAALTRETHLKVAMPNMLSGQVQGQLLTSICRMLQPLRILEIGTFTGYSAICMARGLADGGKLITIDVNEELEPIASKYFKLAGVENQIEMLLGKALEIIPKRSETYDLVFIDADKQNYPEYLDLVLPKVRKGGFILADNILWKGKVLEEKQDRDTAALHLYNEKVAAHPQLRQLILPLRDGLNLAEKL